jgi:hypothetical protein
VDLYRLNRTGRFDDASEVDLSASLMDSGAVESTYRTCGASSSRIPVLQEWGTKETHFRK